MFPCARGLVFTALIAATLADCALVMSSVAVARADAFTTGALRGFVKDKTSGEAAAGATVVATSPALQGDQVVVADDSGGYYFTSLAPGIYTLTVSYNDVTYVRDNALVQVGKETGLPVLRRRALCPRLL